MGEQFWGRAARASNDSKESGRLLNFWALFPIRQLFEKERISADIFLSTQLSPECDPAWPARLLAYWLPVLGQVCDPAHRV